MGVDIFHLSDLHVGGNKVKCKAGNISAFDFMKNHVVPALVKIGKDSEKCVFVITGDVVDDGEKSQMLLANNSLKELISQFRVLIVPGNHDYGKDGVKINPANLDNFKEIFQINSDFPINEVIDGHSFIGLNSMASKGKTLWDWFAKGRLGPEQISRAIELIEKAKADSPEKKVIVYLHHHPFIFPDEFAFTLIFDWLGLQLQDNNRFIRRLKGKVDCLIFGHQHRHLSFVNTSVNKGYGIPFIFCSSSMTKKTKEHFVDKDGYARSRVLNTGFLLKKINLSDVRILENPAGRSDLIRPLYETELRAQ